MKNLMPVSLCTALAGGLGLLFGHAVATASGFAVPEVSAAGVGTANALAANPEEPGAFAYNPAAMGFHDTSSIGIGALFIGPSFSVDTDRSHDSQGAAWIAAPMIQGALRLTDQWRVGLAVNTPFGLETRWDQGTFPPLSGTQLVPTNLPPPYPPAVPVPRGSQPTQSKLEVLDFSPTAAYRVNDDLSLSAGIDYYYAKKAQLNTQLTTLSGESEGGGWGFNLSALYATGPWSIGAAFHSAATLDLEGDLRSTGDWGALPQPPAQGVRLDLDLPWRFQLGARYEVNERLAVELDWTRTGWSLFDELKIKSTSTGDPITSDINAWRDANAYRFAVTYDLQRTTRLRFGYAYDETGQGDDHFSARVPDSDRHLFGIGFGHDLGQGYAIEAGYMYVKFKDRNYRGSKHYIPVRDLGEDVNGTDAINGDYQASAQIFALEVRKTF